MKGSQKLEPRSAKLLNDLAFDTSRIVTADYYTIITEKSECHSSMTPPTQPALTLKIPQSL